MFKNTNSRQLNLNALISNKSEKLKTQSKTIERKITLSSSISSIKPENTAQRIVNKSNSNSVLNKSVFNRSSKRQPINKKSRFDALNLNIGDTERNFMNFSPLKLRDESNLSRFKSSAPKVKCDSSIERSLEQINQNSNRSNNKHKNKLTKQLTDNSDKLIISSEGSVEKEETFNIIKSLNRIETGQSHNHNNSKMK